MVVLITLHSNLSRQCKLKATAMFKSLHDFLSSEFIKKFENVKLFIVYCEKMYLEVSSIVNGVMLIAFLGAYAVKNGEWGKWKPMWLCGVEMKKRTFGIMGLGRIGYGVAKRIKPFGVERIIYHDVQKLSFASDFGGEYVEFEDLVKESDILCICCNMNPQTRHLFNKKTFQKMKTTAIIINTGRGGIINHDDLYEALTSDQIAAAGLDVTEPEPLPVNHPLLTLNNCVILPHMGSNTWESRNRMAEIAAGNIISVLNKSRPKGEVLRRIEA